MGRRLLIRHATSLNYAGEVSASFNEARMTPLSAGGQMLLRHELQVSPTARIQRYADYWGTAVEAFDLHAPHRTLEVLSTSTVDTTSARSDMSGVSWNEMHSAAIGERWCEFLTFSDYVDAPGEGEQRSEIVDQMRRSPTPRIAIMLAYENVRDRIRYTPGVTTVHTRASESWTDGMGVCQDFSHVTLSLLRAAGIPGRYVSGYLYDGTGEPGVASLGESHAWVEAWNGRWEPLDPTNGREVSDAHVLVARGRDYADVSPLRGIYSGGASSGPTVTVEITELSR